MVAESLVKFGEVGRAPAVPFAFAVAQAAVGRLSVIGAGIRVGLPEGVGRIVTVHGGEGEPVGHVPDELEVTGEAVTPALAVVVFLRVEDVGRVLGPPLLTVVRTDVVLHEHVLVGVVAVLVHDVGDIPRHGVVGIFEKTPGGFGAVIGLRIVETEGQREAVRNRGGQVHAAGGLAEAGVDGGTELVVVVRAQEVADLAGLAGNGSVVVLGVTGLEAVADPVEILLEQGLGIVGREVVRLGHRTGELIEFGGVHRFEAAGQRALDTGSDLEFDFGLVLVAALGGHDDDTAGSGGTVESRGGSVLQDGDGLNIVGVEGTTGDTVYDVERAGTGGDGPGTADADVGGLARTAGTVHDDDARDLALEHVTDIGGADVAEFLTAHGNDGAGQLGLFLGRVTEDDDLFEDGIVLGQHDVDDGTGTDSLLEVGVADAGDGQHVARVGHDDKLAVVVRRNAAARRKHDAGADDRFACVGIQHLAGNLMLLAEHRN